MDLYDDIDTKQKTSQVEGWSSGIKMLQTQLAIKKAQQPKTKGPSTKPLMTPVANFRAKRPNDSDGANTNLAPTSANSQKSAIKSSALSLSTLENVNVDDWDFADEYDPQKPNEYEKLKEKIKSERNRSSSSTRDDRERRRSNRSNSRNAQSSPRSHRHNDDERSSPPLASKGGAAIAPPPSLQEISIDNGDGSTVTIPYSASSVAAKIMAKYGFKDGQGLGKSEQGMSVALQVEKTSKRGGRIIHEKDVFLPPPGAVSSTSITHLEQASTLSQSNSKEASPPASLVMPPPPPPAPGVGSTRAAAQASTEPSITEIMKDPSKVVLLRNMVGPGDVDEELEPEVKDECNHKYGDVISVVIHESFGTSPEDAVKIYVEFKRIESAIKAVVDLNGRFFGGRQVRAGFYNYEKFKSFQLH